MESRQDKLLREYIRRSLKQKLINEDQPYSNLPQYSGYYALDKAEYAAGLQAMGDRMTAGFMNSGQIIQPSFYSGGEDPGPLLKAFVEPFTDVFKTAVAGVKAITTDVATLLRVAFETVVTTIVPFISADYQAIFDRRDKRMEDIQREYEDVYSRTDAALGGDDAKLLGFMLNPAAFLAGSAALKAPAATKELLSIATGGASDNALTNAKESWDSIQRAILNDRIGKKKAKKQKDDVYSQLIAALSGGGKNESYIPNRGKKLFEKSDKGKDGSFDDFLRDVLKNEKVVQVLAQKIKGPPRMKEMTKKLSDIEKETLAAAEQSAEKFTKEVSTLEGIKKLAAKDSKGKKAIEQIKDPGTEKMLINSAKKATSQIFSSTLAARMKMLPKGSEEYKEYQKTLQKVSKL